MEYDKKKLKEFEEHMGLELQEDGWFESTVLTGDLHGKK